ncbi:MAG: serine/threonine-protein kinase, partial [Kofleriaceae bacterium]
AVADAMAYAHGQNVIHRDLKPHNVMIGEFGETVVIDWGLAKDLSDGTIDSLAFSDLGGEALTIAGSVVGTPAYLAPEQARGEPVDRTADVYSLGAILYELLAGRAPYKGPTAEAILAAVATVPPPPLPATFPDELVAIVTRAMAREPADRYPSAREFADDLRRFQSGQLVGAHRYSMRALISRWARKHRAVLATAGVALAVVVVLGVIGVRALIAERETAEAARASAEVSQQRAEETLGRANDLAKFMARDLRDKLASLDRIELMEPIARKAIEYRTWSATDHAATAAAHIDLADALAAQAKYVEADAELVLAIADFDRIAKPTTAQRRDRSTVINRRGDLVRGRGDPAAAIALFRQALADVTAISREEPANDMFRLDIAFGESKLADALLALPDPKTALEAAGRARVVLEGMTGGTAVRRARINRELGWIHQLTGECYSKLGDSARGIAELVEAVAIHRSLAAADPAWRTQRTYAIAIQRLAIARGAAGDDTGAQRELEALEAQSTKTLRLDPGNMMLQRDVMLATSALAAYATDRGDHVAARDRYVAALATAEHIVKQASASRASQVDVANMLGRLAVTETRLGAHDRATALAERAITIRKQLVAGAPTDRAVKRDLAVGYHDLARMNLLRKNLAGARAHAELELAVMQELATAAPTDAGAQNDLAVAHSTLAELLDKLGKRDEALREYRIDLEITEALVAKDPANAKWLGELAESHGDIADLLVARGDRAGARASYDAAIVAATRAKQTKELAALRAKRARL